MRFKCPKTSLRLLMFAAAWALLITTTAVAQDDIYVTKAGSPAPTGSLSDPYQLVEAGIVRTKTSPANTVQIAAGKYYETFTANTPCILKATGETVTIGKLDYQASTTLEIITLNTHLFGAAMPFPFTCSENWLDGLRASQIGEQLNTLREEGVDFVGLQEVWDKGLFQGISIICGYVVDPTIWPGSGYPYGIGGWETDCLICIPSGLVMLSAHSLLEFRQVFWNDCAGVFDDCLASKGWVQATIVKDGFSIGLFNTHTDADYSSSDLEARASQIAQLRDAITSYRVSHPSHVVFAMGDFNVYGEQPEYYNELISRMGTQAAGRDADRNSPGFVFGSSEVWTYCACNPLAFYFDDEAITGRLDYIFYFPSLDGSVEVIPTSVNVLHFTGWLRSEDGLATNQSSDHWSVHGQFEVIRR